MIWTSLMKSLGKSGLMGRSVRRLVRISLSLGLPSLLMKPPANLPAAYHFSRKSTVRGKKSCPSFTSLDMTTLANTIASPLDTRTAPSACLARYPVLNPIFFDPISTLISVLIFFTCNKLTSPAR